VEACLGITQVLHNQHICTPNYSAKNFWELYPETALEQDYLNC